MDTIANMLTTIKNGLAVKRETVKTPYSKVNLGIAKILAEEGWVKSFEVKTKGEKASLIFTLKYNEDKSPAILQLERVSKSGKRVYVPYDEIPNVRGGYGTAFISTPHGVLAGKQAKKEKVGGELLCIVY